MSRRIMTTENLEEDVRIENHLRPQLLEDYIGQAKAKEMLKIYIEASKEISLGQNHTWPPLTRSGLLIDAMMMNHNGYRQIRNTHASRK